MDNECNGEKDKEKEINDQAQRFPEPESAVVNIDDRLTKLEEELYAVKQSMFAWNRLVWSVVFVILCITWGFKIWDFLKEVFRFLYNIPSWVFEKFDWYVSYFAERVIGMVFSITILFLVISRIIIWVDPLIDKVWVWLRKRQKVQRDKYRKIEKLINGDSKDL